VPALERLLKRDGAITIGGLFALWTLTWLYLAAGAGLGMNAWDMTTLALLPQQHNAGPMPGAKMAAMTAAWGPGYWALMVGMWWAMMIAMMTPSAAPTILLYARVHSHSQTQGDAPATRAPIGAFVAGYFLMWLVFAIAATALHQALQQAGIVSAITMGSQVRWLSGAALVVTGLYQLSPLKNACLSQCRAPAAFLSRHWRPGASGALRLGVLHGAFCIGCCWMLMALLFVGGVMNLAWIAALSLLVLAEKVLAAGRWVGRCAGIALLAWGLAILLG
jgi:predicted metal-binding membrane protein